MIVTDIILNNDLEEKILYETPLLQHSMYEVPYDHYKRKLIPWHWHGELELLYLASGMCRYKTIRKTYLLRAGDAIYLNPGVLHEFEPLEPGTISYANLFRREFLSGKEGSYWDIAFLSPVLNQPITEALYFCHDDPASEYILGLIRETIRLCSEEPECYELQLRNTLSEIWCHIYKSVTGRSNENNQLQTTSRDARLKKMLLFISERYHESISVAEIAKAANISEREGFRLFRELLDCTPISFLQQYRLQQAESLLLTGNDSITEIAAKTGFDSAAYFSKLFKKNYSLSPLQYKKKYLSGLL